MYIDEARGLEETKYYKYKDFDIMISHYEYDVEGLEFYYYVAHIKRAGIYQDSTCIRKPINRFIRYNNENKSLSYAYVLSQCKYEINKIIVKEQGKI